MLSLHFFILCDGKNRKRFKKRELERPKDDWLLNCSFASDFDSKHKKEDTRRVFYPIATGRKIKLNPRETPEGGMCFSRHKTEAADLLWLQQSPWVVTAAAGTSSAPVQVTLSPSKDSLQFCPRLVPVVCLSVVNLNQPTLQQQEPVESFSVTVTMETRYPSILVTPQHSGSNSLAELLHFPLTDKPTMPQPNSHTQGR